MNDFIANVRFYTVFTQYSSLGGPISTKKTENNVCKTTTISATSQR